MTITVFADYLNSFAGVQTGMRINDTDTSISIENGATYIFNIYSFYDTSSNTNTTSYAIATRLE